MYVFLFDALLFECLTGLNHLLCCNETCLSGSITSVIITISIPPNLCCCLTANDPSLIRRELLSLTRPSASAVLVIGGAGELSWSVNTGVRSGLLCRSQLHEGSQTLLRAARQAGSTPVCFRLVHVL